ncbi:MAG: coenzyme F420-reducing hydrogenase, FrhD protein [Methanolinea sp.]|nr:coenzyme F420-reducing hydrogenase, FrhD protein [Methanolinea sp.]
MLYPEIVIAGCGNFLFADDGFGPAVVEELRQLDLPDNVKAVDAGLGAPHFIFTLLDPAVTRKLIVVDTVDFGGEPGEIRSIPPEDLPPGCYRDAHSWDLTEPLLRLKDAMEIIVIGCQPRRVSAPELEIGLSDEVSAAIPRAVKEILAHIGVDYGTTLENLRKEEHQREAGGKTCGRGWCGEEG